jgi:hypothetical protein
MALGQFHASPGRGARRANCLTPREVRMTTSGKFATLAVACVACLSPVGAQTPGAGDRVAALKKALAENKAALKQYTWIETTEISLKGEEKKQERKQCVYAADGSVTKTPIADAAPAQPQQPQQSSRRRGGGAVKKAVVANKIDDMKEYMGKVKALVQDYVPPDPARIQAAQQAGNVSMEGAALTLKNYVKPGDSMSLGLDPKGTAIRTFNLKSYVQKPKDDDVTMSVTYGTLPDGTSYPQRTVLDVAAKKIGVTITNSDYKKVGS